jgi:hypothetical protein
MGIKLCSTRAMHPHLPWNAQGEGVHGAAYRHSFHLIAQRQSVAALISHDGVGGC